MTISTEKLRELASLMLWAAEAQLPPDGDPTYDQAIAKRIIESMQTQIKAGVACIMALSDEVDKLRMEQYNDEKQRTTVH